MVFGIHIVQSIHLQKETRIKKNLSGFKFYLFLEVDLLELLPYSSGTKGHCHTKMSNL